MNVHFKVTRYKSSFDFVQKKPGRFDARKKNNCMDLLEIIEYRDRELKTLWSGLCQSVANHPDAPADGSWSLATGTFTVKLFEQQRAFPCAVHGIGGGYDKAGRYIDPVKFTLPGSDLRFLFHDDQSRTISGKRDSACFSAGCIIQPAPQYADFTIFLLNHFKPGDHVPLFIVEV